MVRGGLSNEARMNEFNEITWRIIRNLDFLRVSAKSNLRKKSAQNTKKVCRCDTPKPPRLCRARVATYLVFSFDVLVKAHSLRPAKSPGLSEVGGFFSFISLIAGL
jgi:hypothetical protein